MFITELFEATKGTAVLAYGRFNPPTIGHQKLIDKVLSIPGDHYIIVSHSQDNKKNPLSAGEKITWLNKMYPGKRCFYAASAESPSIMTWASTLYQKGYKNLIVICGDDRVPAFTALLNQYNGGFNDEGQGYNFNSLEILSSGVRDPDADGAEGMSASKLRELAMAGNENEFKLGLHPALRPFAHKIMTQISSRIGVKKPKKKNVS